MLHSLVIGMTLAITSGSEFSASHSSFTPPLGNLFFIFSLPPPGNNFSSAVRGTLPWRPNIHSSDRARQSSMASHNALFAFRVHVTDRYRHRARKLWGWERGEDRHNVCSGVDGMSSSNSLVSPLFMYLCVTQ